MPRASSQSPPRPLAPGDVVATFSDELGGWTAAQITGINAKDRVVGVLDLDWSGPEPSHVHDVMVGERLVGVGETRRLPWLLPKGYKVLGNTTPISGMSGFGTDVWDTGWTLFERREQTRNHEWDQRTVKAHIGETRLDRLLGDSDFVDPRMLHLALTPGPITGPVVDCDRLVRGFPNLVSLTVFGIMARLHNAGALNRLGRLRLLDIEEAFGMRAHDAPDPDQLTRLEHLRFDSVPAEYASATWQRWRGAETEGIEVSIRRARTPRWVAQNGSNPLRAWDGREGITASSYARARAAWNRKTPAIMAALGDDLTNDRRERLLRQLGLDFADAFDEVNLGSAFIESQERDELIDGLVNLVGQAPVAPGVDRNHATDVLLHAVNEARTW